MSRLTPSTGAGNYRDVGHDIATIKLKTLGLCQFVVDACPKNGRTQSALSSIQSGARLAIEELQELLASEARVGDKKS